MARGVCLAVIAAVIACLLLRTAPIAARLSHVQPQAATVQVTGTVIDSATGEPVKDAFVALFADSGPSLARQQLTTADGRFAFRDAPRTIYYLKARKFTAEGAFGRWWVGGGPAPLDVRSVLTVPDLKLSLWRPAEIKGIVFDEFGQPLPDVDVRVTPLTGTSGGFIGFGGTQFGARTDDRGRYEVSFLRAGDYVAFVPILHRGTNLDEIGADRRRGLPRGLTGASGVFLPLWDEPTPPPPGANGELYTYVTTFAGSATTRANAAVISLDAGEERTGVDIRLRLARRWQVSGTVVRPNTPLVTEHVDLWLIPEGGDPADLDDYPRTLATGNRFTFPSVPPGRYALIARLRYWFADMGTSDPLGLSARVDVVVTDADVGGVAVNLRPGVTVSGQLAFDGGTTPQPRELRLRLRPESGHEIAAQITGASFVFTGVPPGRCHVALEDGGKWRLKDATIRGRDVADVPFDVTTEAVGDIALTLTNRPTRIDGVVRDLRGPTPEAAVMLFPVDQRLWAWPARARWVHERSPNLEGVYAFADVPPGEYDVAAVRGRALIKWPDPAVMASLAATASRVRVVEGLRAVQDLIVRER